MKLRTKLCIVGIVSLGLLFLKRCQPDPVPPTELPSGTVAVVHSGATHTTLVDNTGVSVIPNYGHGTVTTVKPDGKTAVKARSFGLSYDPGLSTDFHHLGIGMEVLYWRRLNLLVGINMFDFNKGRADIGAWAGLGYRLPFKRLNNFSVYTAYDTDAKIRIGLFLRFGNS